jgi:hypothetical protein
VPAQEGDERADVVVCFRTVVCFISVSMSHIFEASVLMRSMCRRKSARVVAKGEGQPGVQSQWVGTTWFRRLVQKDSCFEHEQVRHVLKSFV